MSQHNFYEDGEDENDENELSTSEQDDEFQEDMEALSQACQKTGTDPSNIQIADGEFAGRGVSLSSDSESGDDMELYRNILDVCKPISLKPLATLHPITSDDDDAEDDLQTLRAIERRIAAYTASESGRIESDHSERFHDLEELHGTADLSSKNLKMLSSSLTHSHQSCAGNISENLTFPKSAHMLFDAIKKNRSYQKFIRNKLTQIEAKIDGNKQLMERVKILKDLGTYSKKRTGRALNPRTDLRIRLISARKPRASMDLEDNEKVSIKYYGPPENSQVANYKMALAQFPLLLHRKKWSKEERESLTKGIRQQFQEKVLQGSVDWFSATEESGRNGSNLDSIIASIKDLEITPEMIREFLPKVNWNQLALMYVPLRSGAECETRWLNCEDPLINRRPWTTEEDKKLLFIIQQKGIANWHDIAVSLGTNRTPFQCLVRYQRSLNACILNREWTEEEDDKLRSAVEELGERNWQSVAWALTGRTGSQCSNRWKKSLNPARQRVGKWNPDEDKRLEVAVMLFKPKNWKRIAEFVPGRTQVQCRERWVNSLDPSIKRSKWTEGEDARLEAAIQEHGHCWSKVATRMDSRTDNQCWRRWKLLHPDQLHLLQEARKIRKSVCISNFVDRESERPALGPSDFIPLAILGPTSEPEKVNTPSNHKRKRRRKVHSSSEEVHETISRDEIEASGVKDGNRKVRRKKHHENNNGTEPDLDESLPLSVLITRIGREGKQSSLTERKGSTKRTLKRHLGMGGFSKLGKKQNSNGSKTCNLPETVDDSAVMNDSSSVSEDIVVVGQNKKRASETGARGTKPSPQSSVTIRSVENLSLNRYSPNEGTKGPGQECESRNNRELFCNKLKIKRKPRIIENANTSEPDGDDMKLATFLQRKLKKKRHQDSNSEQSLSLVQNDNAKTCCKNAVPECASERVVVAEDDSPADHIRERGSCSSQKTDLKAGDGIRVYCRKRLKKKQLSL